MHLTRNVFFAMLHKVALDGKESVTIDYKVIDGDLGLNGIAWTRTRVPA